MINQYIHQNRTVNYERFPSEYFSGGDIKIYFEDTFLDECTMLQFVLAEQVLPIYGYNSYTFDDVLRGNRIIQGTFRINFKDRGYLFGLLEHILEEKTDMIKDDVKNQDRMIAEDLDKLYLYAEEGWSREFDFMSQKFEDAIWNRQSRKDTQRINEPFFPKKGFDIIITYGPYKRAEYQDIEKYYQKFIGKGTVKAIYGVQLTSVQQIIDMSGKPIEEEYTFIAKDLDREEKF